VEGPIAMPMGSKINLFTAFMGFPGGRNRVVPRALKSKAGARWPTGRRSAGPIDLRFWLQPEGSAQRVTNPGTERGQKTGFMETEKENGT